MEKGHEDTRNGCPVGLTGKSGLSIGRLTAPAAIDLIPKAISRLCCWQGVNTLVGFLTDLISLSC